MWLVSKKNGPARWHTMAGPIFNKKYFKMKFEDIDFNDVHLSGFSKEKFIKEVSHHLDEKKAEELYDLIQKKHGNHKSGIKQGKDVRSDIGSEEKFD